MTNETTTKSTLSEAQRARIQAIRVAREVLQNTGGAGALSRQAAVLPNHRTINDLVDVGRWIETGKHPLDDFTDTQEGES